MPGPRQADASFVQYVVDPYTELRVQQPSVIIGPCVSSTSQDRLDVRELLGLIRAKQYFVLHAPCQTGKTSALIALRDLDETMVLFEASRDWPHSVAGIAALLERVAAAGQGSFLVVLKLFGPAGEGLMSFPMEGCTLALLDGLDEITHRRGGRVYLAKDACCAPERIREGYPRLGAFGAVHAEAIGAPPRFASELSRRFTL